VEFFFLLEEQEVGVSWEIVTMPKWQWGLGIRNLYTHSQALLPNLAAKLLSWMLQNNGT
jgi:hypothetical protein